MNLSRAESRSEYSDHASGSVTAAQRLSDAAFFRAMVEFEAALTESAATVANVADVDADAAAQVAAKIRAFTPDVAALGDAAVAGGNPAISLVKAIKAEVKDAGLPVKAVHVGATSQDVIDSALVLCLRDAVTGTLEVLDSLCATVADLAARERTTAQVGRTLGQQAVPTTFGLTAAGWLQQLHTGAEELRRVLAELPVQYAGAAGNLAASGPQALKIHRDLAERLGLRPTPLVWHTDRTPVVRLASALALVAGAVRKIAGDVVFLSATEVGEVREAAPGGSSAMPHKASPAGAIAADGYARRVVGYTTTLMEAMDGRLQRAAGAWHAEWQTVRDLAVVTDNAVTRLAASLDGVVVDHDALDRNLRLTGGAVLAEAFARVLGRDAVDTAVAEGRLLELIADASRDHGISADPADHTGHSPEMVDLILTDYRSSRD